MLVLRFQLGDALTRARITLHSFRKELVDQDIQEGLKIARKLGRKNPLQDNVLQAKPSRHDSSALEVAQLVLRPERTSLQVERFREDGVAIVPHGDGFAVQAGFCLGTSICGHGEFRSRRSL